MKKFLLILLIMIGFEQNAAYGQSKPYEPVVVLELFTSQGCSSCPAADALLGTWALKGADRNVYALSYHVDYWDYIGWKDPFSKKEFADKQRRYAAKFRSNSIYTPQVVVNGREHFVGSDQTVLNTKLAEYAKKQTQNQIKIQSERVGNQIKVTYNVEGATQGKKIRFDMVIQERTTNVSRGENKNKVLKNSNIVVSEIGFGLDKAQGEQVLEIPSLVQASDTVKIIAIVQDEALNITGASQIVL